VDWQPEDHISPRYHMEMKGTENGKGSSSNCPGKLSIPTGVIVHVSGSWNSTLSVGKNLVVIALL